jgi:hypothetical protein
MADFSSFPDNYLEFFRLLFIKTGGNLQKQVSMHEIGNEVGMDKSASKTVAEELMRIGLIDIRTLSGGIGLTEEGLFEAQNRFPDIAGISTLIKLGNHPVVGEKTGTAITEILNHLKPQIGKLGLAYNELTELIADIQTLDAQMRSPRPKSSIVRECFRSIQPLLSPTDESEIQTRIKSFLSD